MRILFSRIRYPVYDAIHFLEKLTSAKIINFFKVFVSFYISKANKKPLIYGYPVSISIEPTTSCNLRCPECISGLRSFTRPTGMLDDKLFSTVINQLKNELINLTLYFQGEPFLNPGFFNMVAFAHKNRIYTHTSTNGHYLSEENTKKAVTAGLDRLIISVDNFDQDSYVKYRVGGDIETVKSGIKTLVKIRKQLNARRPYIILQFLVNRENEKSIKQLKRDSYELGADKVVFKTMQIYDYQSGSPFIPENEKYSRYLKTGEQSYKLKNELYNHCWKMWHSCVLTWDGRVLPCCFDKNANHSVGTLNGVSLKSIWKSDSYNSFRSKVLNSRSSVDICTNCSEGSKAWI